MQIKSIPGRSYLELTCKKCECVLAIYPEDLWLRLSNGNFQTVCVACKKELIVVKSDVPKGWIK